jgi:hypothetical protein
MEARETQRRIGAILVIMGSLSAVLSLIGYELRLLIWIDLFGPVGAWLVRALLVGGGALLYVFGRHDRRPQADKRDVDVAGAVCAECGERIQHADDGRECDRCAKPVHDGDCENQHEAKHLKRIRGRA